MTEKTEVIMVRAKECELKRMQLWLSNESFNDFVKEVGNLSLNKEGNLILKGKGKNCDIKYEIAIGKCKTANAFAKIIGISEVNWYTNIEIKSVFKSPENSKEILIL